MPVNIDRLVNEIYEAVTKPCAIYDSKIREDHYREHIKYILETSLSSKNNEAPCLACWIEEKGSISNA